MLKKLQFTNKETWDDNVIKMMMDQVAVWNYSLDRVLFGHVLQERRLAMVVVVEVDAKRVVVEVCHMAINLTRTHTNGQTGKARRGVHKAR